MEILDEIQHRIESESRSSGELVSTLRQLGTYMFITGTITKEQVVTFCSSLIKLYNNTKEKYDAKVSN